MSEIQALHHPVKNPERILSIAGQNLLIDDMDRAHLPRTLKAFVVDKNDFDFQYQAHRTVIEQQPFLQAPLFDSGGLWRVYGEVNAPILALQYANKIYQYARFNQSLTQAEVFLDLQQLKPGVSPFSLRQPLLELWYAFWLARGHGLLLHGCGVRDAQGFVDVFLGESGAGKSTFGGIVASAKAGDVLSDDRLIVRREPARDGQANVGAYRVYGTPWHGEARFAQPAFGVLRSLNFLQQNNFSRREALPVAETARRLFTCSFLPGWPRTETLNFVLEQCALLATEVSGFVMHFRPDKSALQAADLQQNQAQLLVDIKNTKAQSEVGL